MPKRKSSTDDASTILMNLIQYCDEEKRCGKYAFPVEQVVNRVAAMTGKSERSIVRIRREMYKTQKLYASTSGLTSDKPSTTESDEMVLDDANKHPKIRNLWCKVMKREPFASSQTSHHCCEDHFNLNEDMENFIKYKYVKCYPKLKANVVPQKFECQKLVNKDCIETKYLTRKRTQKVIEDLLECQPSTSNVDETLSIPTEKKALWEKAVRVQEDTEDLNDSSTDIPLKYEANIVKKELNYEEEEKWPEVDMNSEDIDTNDIKQEPTEIIFFKTEVPCSNCYHNLEEGVFWLLSNLGAKANNDLPKTVPKNFLKIDQNVSVLRCIPQDIIFGPYADFESLQNVTSLIWILNGGRQTEIDNKFLDNWMRFISFSTDKDRCNLSVFQCNRFLYFRTIRNIACEEELLAYLDERLVKPSSEKCYYPIEEDIPQAYACMPCCLGFKTEGYLRKHLEICFNNKESNRSLADIVQCPHCKMVSFDRKHLKHHISRNCVGDKR